MTGDDLRFGLFVGQGDRTWEEILEGVRLADELGYDYAWVFDHFIWDTMEAWTLLGGLAASTSRVRLGTMVSGNTYRHPSMLMKQAVTVDRISNGRLVLGVGAGWREDEHVMYGWEFPSARERVDRLDEALQIMHALMTRERTTFSGRHYRLENAEFRPPPVQRPRIPVLLGGSGPRMLGLAARYADIWDANRATPEEAEALARRLDGLCREEGRDPGEIRRSIIADADALATEEAFTAFVEAYRPLGYTLFTTDLPAPEGREMMRRIATEVMPRLRREHGPSDRA